VIVFIPIIPLKRVRILDSCSRCSRHWVVDPEQFEMSRQLSVSGALDKHRELSTVETALEAHGQCLAFHMHQDADLFREGALAQFPNNAELLAGFASHLEQMGRWQDAAPLYEQAFAINPDSPQVRFSLAWRRTNEGKLDESYDLLDYLRQPGSGQSFNLDPLLQLAEAYQKKGNHERTLELCAVLLRENPVIGEQHLFRSLVTKSEKALKTESSILPKREFSVRNLFDSKSGAHSPAARWAAIGSIAAVMFLLGMAGLNEYTRRHRTLVVVNAFAQPVQVSVDGGPPVTVHQRTKISISEGSHQVSITGPITKQMAVELRTPYMSRWLSSPLWVIDIENMAGVFVNTVKYAVNPQPPETRWLEEEINYVPHVDYPFETPPNSLRLDNRNSVITKVHVGSTTGSPASIMFSRISQPDQTAALAFAEGYLERNPNDAILLAIYAHRAQGDKNEQRVADFLKAGLWREPISVPWHRTYQSLKSVVHQHAKWVTAYDEQLKKSPNNAALIYLRGRISPSRAEQLDHFRKSFDLDPQLGWPAMALAFDAANRGVWMEAKVWCDRAASLGSDQSLRSIQHTVQVGLGDTTALEGTYRQELQGQDSVEMLSALFRLMDALAVAGKTEDARAEYHAWWNRVASGQLNAYGRSPYELMVDYVCGDTEAFLRKQPTLEPTELSSYQFQFLLATGQPDVAAKMPGLEEASGDWTGLLALSVSFGLNGKPAEADVWRDKACEMLTQGDLTMVRAAELLKGQAAPTDEELEELDFSVADSLVLLAAFAQRFPDRKVDFLERAAQLNVSRLSPYLLIKQAVASP
jgi:tetratricopeptide (TPR) repeat protein